MCLPIFLSYLPLPFLFPSILPFPFYIPYPFHVPLPSSSPSTFLFLFPFYLLSFSLFFSIIYIYSGPTAGFMELPISDLTCKERLLDVSLIRVKLILQRWERLDLFPTNEIEYLSQILIFWCLYSFKPKFGNSLIFKTKNFVG